MQRRATSTLRVMESVMYEQIQQPLTDGVGKKKAVLPTGKIRYFLFVFLGFMGLFVVYALRVNLSVAILPMEKQFGWTSETKGIVLSSFFFGYLFGQIPGGFLATKLGAKHVFGIGVLATAILTLLIPLATCWKFHCGADEKESHLWSLIALRIAMGACESVTYPAFLAIIPKWAPSEERSKMVSMSFGGAMIGTAVTFPLTGWILTAKDTPIFGGWEGCFYDLGLFGVLWFLVWTYFVSEYPEENAFVTAEEAHYIVQTRGNTKSTTVPRSVWVAILTNKHALALYACHFVNNWALYTFLSFLPTYLSDVLKFDFTKSALYSVLAMFMFQFVGGLMADYFIERKLLTRTATRVTMVNLGGMLPAAALVWLSYEKNSSTAFALMTLAVGLSGFAYSGYPPAAVDMSPAYSGMLYSISNTYATLPGVISPALTGMIVKDKTQAEWRIVFFIAATLYIVGMLIFWKFGSAELVPELNPENVDGEEENVLRDV